MVLQQNSHHDKVQDVLNYLHKKSVYAVRDSSSEQRYAFVPLDAIISYFEEDRNTRLYDVLEAVYGDDDPPDAGDVLPNYIRVFCILLEIGMGRYLHLFTSSWELNDHRLPYPESKPTGFPLAPERPDFFDSFRKMQWKYCAAELSHPISNIRFEDDLIIPITHKRLIAEGGSSMLHQIKIHKIWNKLLTFVSRRKDSRDHLTDIFVLKTYLTPEAERYYKRETGAFKKLKKIADSTDIIGFYGSYRQGPTYNIILEYANQGTLETYFRTTPPPMKSGDIIDFWTGLFKINKGLKSIHDIEVKSIEGPQVLHGWHQDVKPENILVSSKNGSSPYEWQFKLADLGLSHFKKAVNGGGESTAKDAHGTRTYGAPECYRWDEFMEQTTIKIKQKVDIWSIGCVFSEAAVWMVSGYEGIQSYRQERKAETDKMRDFKDGDCFHDGEEVLDAVSRWHKAVVKSCRICDYITPSVIGLIGDALQSSDYRLTAQQMWGKSQRILRDALDRVEEDERLAGNKKTSNLPPDPPELPSGPPPPRNLHRSSQTWPTNDLAIYSSLSIPDKLKSNNPDRMTTTSDDGSSYDPNGAHLERLSNRSQSQPMFGTNRPNHDSYYGRDRHHTNLEESTIKEGSYDDYSIKICRTGKRPLELRPHTQNQYQKESPMTGRSLLTNVYENDDQARQSTCINPSHREEATNPAMRQTTYYPSPVSLTQNLVNRGLQERTNSSPIEKPYLSVSEALAWKDAKQNRFKGAPPLPHEYLRTRLAMRDHIFLVDNAGSMFQYWAELTNLVSILAYIAKPFDSDGLDMYYTISNGEHINGKHSRKFVKSLNKTSPSGISDISVLLIQILTQYRSKLHQAFGASLTNTRNDIKPLSLYVLTDGIWQPHCNVEDPIKNLIQELINRNLGGEKQVGIQFISFGRNEQGLAKMKALDSSIKADGKRIKLDIVDTEPSNGNVWKMLLGATDRWFDDDEYGDSSINGVVVKD